MKIGDTVIVTKLPHDAKEACITIGMSAKVVKIRDNDDFLLEFPKDTIDGHSGITGDFDRKDFWWVGSYCLSLYVTGTPDLKKVEEALHNLLVSAKPFFTDDIQAMVTADAESALSALRTYNKGVKV